MENESAPSPELEAKPVSASKVEIAQLMQPPDANLFGNVHGGTIMKLIDNAGSIAAFRHAHRNVVSASVDRLDFLSPVYIGNLVVLYASVNYVGRSSMEVGVRVEAECLQTGSRVHCASGFLTFVALDERGNPCEIPPVIPETDVEQRRYSDAQERRKARAHHVQRAKAEAPPCKLPRLNL